MIKIANKILDKAEEILKVKIEEKGFELEYIEQVKENGRDILRVVVTKNESMTTDDCEVISKYIEDDVDKIMKDKEYVLEVSSAGLERQLKNIRLFEKYIGKKAFIRLFKKTKFSDNINFKETEAYIYSVCNQDICFKLENREMFTVNFKDIAQAYTVFDFDKFFKESKDV